MISSYCTALSEFKFVLKRGELINLFLLKQNIYSKRKARRTNQSSPDFFLDHVSSDGGDEGFSKIGVSG